MNKLSGYILNLYFRFPGIRLFFMMMIVFIIFSFATVMVMISDQVKTDPIGWDRMKTLSPAGVTAGSVHADRKGNLAAAIFEGKSKGNTGIYVTLSFDGGVQFIAPHKISEFKSEISNNPRIAISTRGEIFATWYVLSGDEKGSSIFFSRSGDMGASWSEPEVITFGMQMEILPHAVFDDKERLHLFFTSYSGNSFNLFHAAMNEQRVFGKPEPVIKVSGNMRGAFFPAIKIVKNNILVVCQGKGDSYTDHLYFAFSDDYGLNWGKVRQLTTGKFNNQAPSIEVYNDTIFLVYMNNSERNWSINMLRGYKLGESWDDNPLKISTTNANCYSPDIVSSPENELLITWHDLREKGSRIFYRKYSAKSGELLPEGKLSSRQAAGRNPVSINTSKKLVVLWEEAGRIVANYSDNYVAPPNVYSSTNIEDKWSKDNTALIRWTKPQDESGIAGFATMTDKNPNTNPTIQNQRSDASNILITGLDDGVTYFHIRAIDGVGNMSRTVHYKLQVSANPLAQPIIVSTTHPENGVSQATDAFFRWAVNDSRRLKGFVYSISKDTATKPEKFLKEFDIKFSDLETGVYYFNLAAVSTTNQVSRVSTYTFIVGEGAIDTNYLKNLANRDYEKEMKKALTYVPAIDIKLPFGDAGKYNSGSFTAFLKPLNIIPENVSGYSVVIGNEKRVPADKINLLSGTLNVAGLEKGNYTIGVKCRYFKIVNGSKKYFWTGPVYRSFSIVPDVVVSPVEKIYGYLVKKFNTAPLAISMIILLFSTTVVYRGYGDRISFYIKLFNYKLKYYFS